jgi:hypothetical protein
MNSSTNQAALWLQEMKVPLLCTRPGPLTKPVNATLRYTRLEPRKILCLKTASRPTTQCHGSSSPDSKVSHFFSG